MKELKVVSWRVINVDPIGRAKENKEILLDKEEYQYLFSFIKEKRSSKALLCSSSPLTIKVPSSFI